MLSSRLLLNLGLVILLAALASAAYFSSQQQTPVSLFSQLNADDITSIQIDAGQQSTTINKIAEQWEITKPVEVEADKFRLQAMLNILSTSAGTYYEIQPADYKKYSLDPPLASLTLNQQTFLFGSTSTVNQKRYVITNQRLFLIDDIFYPLMTSGYKNLMRRQLFPDQTRLNEISFNNTRLFINDKGGWQADKAQTGGEALKRFVDNWLHIQAYAVSTASEPFTGSKVILKTKDGKTLTRFVQKTDVNTIVINPELGLSYQLDITAYDTLLQADSFVVEENTSSDQQ